MADNEQILNIHYYYYNKSDIDAILEDYAEANHTHDEYLTNTSLNTKVDIAQGTNKALKNVVTDANGNITTEPKPIVPTKVSDLTNDIGFISNVSWTDIDNKPADFTPSTHTHSYTDLTNKPTIPSKTSQIKDSTAYNNIGSAANATQATINSSINTQLGAKINTSDIQNNLESTATNKPLSAYQGKLLNISINTLSQDYNSISLSLDKKENVSNKITSWNNTASNTKYPSEKLVKTALNNKVDKVSGKGLSTNDFTNEYKNKLLNIETNDNILYCYKRKLTSIKLSDFFADTGGMGDEEFEYMQLNFNNLEEYLETEYGTDIKSFFNELLLSVRDTYNNEASFNIDFPKETFLYFEDDIWEEHNNKYHVIVITDSSSYSYECDYYGLTDVLPLDDIAFTGITMETDFLNLSNDNNPATSKAIKDYVDTEIGGVIAGDVDLSSTHNHDDRYFTETEITQKLGLKEDSSNKTSSWHTTTDNTRYPTEKLVKDSLDLKSNDGHTHKNLVETKAISANEDLDSEEYTVEGIYRISNNNAKTLNGSPLPGESRAARIEVKQYKNSSTYIYIQFYYVFYTSYIDIYYRKGMKSTNAPLTWYSWKKISTIDDTIYTAGTGLTLTDKIFSVNYGTTNTTACIGDDSRLSDPRIPKFTSIIPSKNGNNEYIAEDLNTYKTSGFYYCSLNEYAQHIIHCPDSDGTETPYTSNKAFHLLIQSFGQNHNSYVKQTLTYYTTGKTYIRSKYNSNDTTGWTAWQEISVKSDIQNNLTSTATDKPLSAYQGKILNEKTTHNTLVLSENDDLNDITDPGWYRCEYNTKSITLSHTPWQEAPPIDENETGQGRAFAMEVLQGYGRVQILYVYDNDDIWIRRNIHSNLAPENWKPWKKILNTGTFINKPSYIDENYNLSLDYDDDIMNDSRLIKTISGNSTKPTMTYSNETYNYIRNSNTGGYAYHEIPFYDFTKNFKLSCKSKANSNDYSDSGFVLIDSTQDLYLIFSFRASASKIRYSYVIPSLNIAYTHIKDISIANATTFNEWYDVILTKNGEKYIFEIFDSNKNKKLDFDVTISTFDATQNGSSTVLGTISNINIDTIGLCTSWRNIDLSIKDLIITNLGDD